MDLVQHVHNLVGRYCDAVLRADAEAFADTWQAGAEWVIPGAGTVRGRDAVTSTFLDIRPTYRLCVQEVLNGVVEPVTDREASARWQIRELQWRTDGTGSELIGAYDDLIVLDDDGVARFARRAFELRYRGPVDLPGRVYLPAG